MSFGARWSFAFLSFIQNLLGRPVCVLNCSQFGKSTIYVITNEAIFATNRQHSNFLRNAFPLMLY